MLRVLVAVDGSNGGWGRKRHRAAQKSLSVSPGGPDAGDEDRNRGLTSEEMMPIRRDFRDEKLLIVGAGGVL